MILFALDLKDKNESILCKIHHMHSGVVAWYVICKLLSLWWYSVVS